MANSSFYDFHCPKGGRWYACAGGSNFVGCCASDPCSNGCSQGNIRPGGYNISHYAEWPDAACGTASTFYSCSAGDSFWGCCKTNACLANPPATCSGGDLVPAFMDRPEQFSAYASAQAETSSAKSTNVGAIVGGAVGGVVALVLIGVLVFFILRKKKRGRKANEVKGTGLTPMADEKPFPEQQGGLSPPPTYSAAPTQEFYQNMSPVKGQQPYHQYASHADLPQELPAEDSASNHRYSELPADAATASSHRYSELSGVTASRPVELESPRTSPRPLQSEFSTDLVKRAEENKGLGVQMDDLSRGYRNV